MSRVKSQESTGGFKINKQTKYDTKNGDWCCVMKFRIFTDVYLILRWRWKSNKKKREKESVIYEYRNLIQVKVVEPAGRQVIRPNIKFCTLNNQQQLS